MPNRILKDSICTSESVDSLSPFEETFFYRLIVNCDDYGRSDARPAILKSRLFPLKDIRVKQVEDALQKLSSVGTVILYSVDGKPFLQMTNWESHQTIRNKRSKYPAPDSENAKLQAFEIICNQMQSDCQQANKNAPVIQSNPIQSELESESETEGAKLETTSVVIEPPAANLLLNDKSLYSIYQKDIDHWIELYPAVDVVQELRKMQGWIESNPSKRKTRSGIVRFINTWLSKEQDKGGSKAVPVKKTTTSNPFLNMLSEAQK